MTVALCLIAMTLPCQAHGGHATVPPSHGGHATVVYTPLPRLREWTCIHEHEGAWNATGFYEGGLQMDHTFSTTYGADMWRKYGAGPYAWTPREQIMVAERAYKTRGYNPWPNTARMCGLL